MALGVRGDELLAEPDLTVDGVEGLGGGGLLAPHGRELPLGLLDLRAEVAEALLGPGPLAVLRPGGRGGQDEEDERGEAQHRAQRSSGRYVSATYPCRPCHASRSVSAVRVRTRSGAGGPGWTASSS